jgi:hypothetical protein
MHQNGTSMPRTRRSTQPLATPTHVAASPARWSVVLRALREAAWLGFGRSTLQRWESGTLPPGPEAEAALLDLCARRGLFRTFYYQGPLRGLTVSPELLRDLLADARLGTAHESGRGTEPEAEPERPRHVRLPLPRTSFVGRERDLAEV